MTGQTLERHRAQAPAVPDIRQDPMALGKALAASGLFKDAQDENKAFVKVVAGMEMGFGSIAAMTGIHIIEGKPTLGANLLAALVKRDRRYDYRVQTLTDQECSLEFFERGSEAWQSSGVSTFTWDDAVRAQVTGKAVWSRYPRNMLFARALSNGVGFYCPDLTAGSPVYTPEEMDVAIDEEVGEVTPDIPPASPPAAVARSQAKPQAKPQQTTRAAVSAAQKRTIYGESEKAGIKGTHIAKALKVWVSSEPLDRFTKEQASALIDAIKDHEAVIAVIHDRAREGDELAQEIVAKYLSDGEAGEQQELG